jgi:hypothetical protein
MKVCSSSLVVILAGSAVACSSFLDVGGGEEPAPTRPAPPPPAEEVAPPPAAQGCGTIAPTPVAIFRSPSTERFRAWHGASDGTHLYLAGSVVHLPDGIAPPPDPSHPMETASVVRVPVTGGAREIVDYEHITYGDAIALDGDNVYWGGSGDDLMVFSRPKKGGPVASFGIEDLCCGTKSIATDPSGRLFFAGGPILVRTPQDASPRTFLEVVGSEQGVSSIATDGHRVYWLASVNGHWDVRSAPAEGGAWTALATGLPLGRFQPIAVANDRVWLFLNDELSTVPTTGGDRTIVATSAPDNPIRSFTVAGGSVYFTRDTGPIFRANVDGTGVTAITPPQERASLLTADACRVYSAMFESTEYVVYATAR